MAQERPTDHPGQAAGGYARAALAPDRSSLTTEARDAKWRAYLDRVQAALPELDPVDDAAEIARRADLMRKADLMRMSAKGQRVRRLKSELKKAEADLAASDDVA